MGDAEQRSSSPSVIGMRDVAERASRSIWFILGREVAKRLDVVIVERRSTLSSQPFDIVSIGDVVVRNLSRRRSNVRSAWLL